MAETIELGFTLRLLEDVGKCIPHWHGEDAQFWRRAAYRGLFGFLEAWMAVARNHYVPDMIRERGDSLLPDDETKRYVGGLLVATDYHETVLNDKGEFDIKKRKHRFKPFVKAVMRLFLIVGGKAKDEIDAVFTQPGWHSLVEAVKVRDRLTHPHEHSDVFVADNDLKHLDVVLQWLINSNLSAVKE
jgi:hypothetical protein